MTFGKYLLAAGFGAAYLFGTVGAHAASQCTATGAPLVTQYASGSTSLTYQTCQDGTRIYLSGVMTYNNVSFDGQFTLNGTLGVEIDMSNGMIGSVEINGGPLAVSIGGQPYTVTANQLAFGFNAALQPTWATGSVVINGQVTQGNTALWNYLYR